MALCGPTQMGCVTLLVSVLLSLSSTGKGFKQEFWIYTADGNEHLVQTHVPDLTKFSANLSEIAYVCCNGLWSYFSAVNYQVYYNGLGVGTKEFRCTEWNITTVKSLRHWAAIDTATDAISLYSGKNREGEEIFVTTRAKTDISIPIITLAATGTSDWMLYEGKNFEGRSVCFQVPVSNMEFNFGHIVNFNMTTIGSVFKSCDLNEIQVYKESILLYTHIEKQIVQLNK